MVQEKMGEKQKKSGEGEGERGRAAAGEGGKREEGNVFHCIGFMEF